MQYILSQSELNNLVPEATMQAAEEAIDWFHKEFIGDKCIHHLNSSGTFGFCDERCPIGQLKDHVLRNKLCTQEKKWGK